MEAREHLHVQGRKSGPAHLPLKGKAREFNLHTEQFISLGVLQKNRRDMWGLRVKRATTSFFRGGKLSPGREEELTKTSQQRNAGNPP